ncbi:conserved hypothetical protein [Nautilia profundicola AmH]|uniref:YlxR domain-containing protein n=1 Tax=Nautilia profundicola (strain ATCC BAA-1463 / DSM 18972 / AmH) TaxID=598659 RepID=B9L6E5_NAUPA|nr:DUF448 domain-containing protein [Nautilia profundicola]ACM92404.1 conserved hypothetical protein [Nautilia profundicola AmH]
MENEHKPIRMCVVCRKRLFQKELYRLQCKNRKLSPFDGFGRSFYVCDNCKNEKKFINYISKICKITKEKAKEEIVHFPFSILN